ncbi:hypothetical protein M3693_12430 [Cellulosimicrobium funkei]|uniref:hypothetical protein n=1 Tax=Cellulosimicrobium funkei TaxID=264251 RepID=UPI00203B0FCF|nr:hypothetical protein [Cellulosimicrobium funkei]MCM3535023.1 hypothetical protein [Cellulosimicrobium funkei]
MFAHVSMLGELAQQYHDSHGVLGGSLTDAATQVGIEVALHDKGLSTPAISTGFRTSLRAGPHVKVDDYKSPTDCGRIYFAIDDVAFRFVVDHIDLHDYG